MTNHCKPFDLERALSGEKLITRDGTRVTEFHYFSSLKDHPYPIVSFINGMLYDHKLNGHVRRFREDEDSDYDLFHPISVKRVWVNIYCFKDYPSHITTGITLNSEDEAKALISADPEKVYLRTIYLDIPDEVQL